MNSKAAALKVKKRTEHDLQCAVVAWAAMQTGIMPALKLLYAIPNGAFFGAGDKVLASGKKIPLGVIRAARLKKEGLRVGVPDLCLPVARATYHGLYIELKNGDAGTVSPEQTVWIEALRAEGYAAVICRTFKEATDTLRAYLIPPVLSTNLRDISGSLASEMVSCPNCSDMHFVINGNFYCKNCADFFQRIGAPSHINAAGEMTHL